VENKLQLSWTSLRSACATFVAGVSMKRDKMSSISSSTATRLKGLVWIVGGIALIFTLISLAPVISHLG
jgi:hypothetical protein